MSFHQYRINELYTNADGTIQFIEFAVGNFNGESFWSGQSLSVTQGGTEHTFTFLADLPSFQTANTKVLVATQGFANLGIVTPDFIVPAGFLFTGGGTVNFANVDFLPYAPLPTNGTHSVGRSGALGVNSPTNFAGSTGTLQSGVIAGTDNPESLFGTGGADTIMSVGGNDTLNGGGGNDSFDGGNGIDVATYSGARSAYVAAKSGSGYTVSGPEGSDTLISVERAQFSDRGLAFDLELNANAGNTVRIIGAAFDGPTIGQHPDYVGIGLTLFDSHQTMLQVCTLVVGILNLTNVQFVNRVYENVAGGPPSLADQTLLVAQLQGNGGQMTQAQMLEFAANHPVNETNINLVGLQASGVEFAFV